MHDSEDLTKQVEFLKEIEKLKLVCRANKTLGGSRFENSAEHSWHVALMAVLLSDRVERNIDLLKVVKMLLIHDLVEIDVGDTWLYSAEREKAFELEKSGADRIFGMLPEVQRAEFISLWHEFEMRTTDESKFAASIDGIQPLLNHLVTGNPNDGTIALEKVKSKKEYIQKDSPQLWGLVEELIRLSVEKGLYQ